MTRSTRLRAVRIGLAVGAVLMLVLCASVASWRGILALLSLALSIVFLLAGWYVLLPRYGGSVRQQRFVMSAWLGFTMFGLSVAWIYLDPDSALFTPWHNIGSAAFVGFCFMVASLVLSSAFQPMMRGQMLKKGVTRLDDESNLQ